MNRTADLNIENHVVMSSYPTPRTPHVTIVIASHANWVAIATSGSGVAGDPYIIEDYDIDCGGVGTGITITGTTDHGEIRNVHVNNSGSGSNGGIVLQGVANVLVTNCTLDYNNVNLAFVTTSNCNATNSTIAHAKGSINMLMDNSDNALLSNLIFLNGTLLATRLFTTGNSQNITFDDSIVQNDTTLAYVDNWSLDNITMNGSVYCYNAENFTIANSIFRDQWRLASSENFSFGLSNFYLMGSDAINLLTGNGNDITVDSCSVYNCNAVIHVDSGDTNLVIANTTCINSSYLVSAISCDNITVENCRTTNNTYGVYIATCTGIVLIQNNTFLYTSSHAVLIQATISVDIINNTIFSAGRGIYISAASNNATITGNVIQHLMISDAISTDASNGTYIALNWIYAPGNVTNGETPAAIAVTNGNNIIIENNTCLHVNGTVDGYGTFVSGASANVMIRFNHYEECFFGVATWSLSPVTVHHNWFRGNFDDFEEPTLGLNVFGYNYYFEYFNTYPSDVTVNTTTDVLPHPYLAFHHRSHFPDPPLYRNDTHPLYWAAWYPRSDVVYLQFDSIVNGQEIPLGNLRVYLNGGLITTLSPKISNLLFRITAYDLSGNLYHDSMYNLNATGIYLQITLDLAIQCFIALFSNIDNFGLPFEIVKLFINGTRVTTNAPTMLSVLSLITIKDYADSILYNQVLNLSIVGIYLDLGLAIATITFSNEYNQTVIFYLMKSGVTVSFTIPRLSSITVRLAMGDYTYEITDLVGNELESGDLTFMAGDVASFFVVFGKVSVTTPGGLPDATAQLLGVTLITVGVLGAVLVFATIVSRGSSGSGSSRSSPKSRPRSRKNKKYKYVM